MSIIFLFILSFLNTAYANEQKVIDAQEFVAENPSEERIKIVNFLVKQFDQKRNIGVSQKELDKIWFHPDAANDLHLVRFQIVNQQLYAGSASIYRPYFLNLLEYFQEFVKRYKVRDVDFIVYARDEVYPFTKISPSLLAIPAFMMFRNPNSEYEKDKFLLPDSNMLKKSWYNLINKIEENKKFYPWNKKLNKVFWRGAATGGEAKYSYNISNIDKLPRLKITMLSKLYPNLIDGQLVNPIFSNDQDGQNLSLVLKMLFNNSNKPTKEIEHLPYKYLLSVDGNSCTGTRVPWIMLSNSVLLKQESIKIQWFYSALKPYVHYVPIKNDLTDIFKQINWMKKHDEQIQNISNNANKFVKENLLPEHIDSHVSIILNEYHKIQKDEVIIPTLPSAEELLSGYLLYKNLLTYLKDKFITNLSK